MKCEPPKRGGRGGRTQAEPEEVAVVRCPSCSGLRTISYRNRDTDARCLDCRRGEIVRRETYWDWWLERFSAAECAAMARAIWGSSMAGSRNDARVTMRPARM